MRHVYPIRYTINYFSVDGKRPTNRVGVDTGEIDIPEVTSAEAPVSLRWKKSDAPTITLIGRHYEGRFYRPAAQIAYGRTMAEQLDHFLGSDTKAGIMPAADKIAHRLGDTRAKATAHYRDIAEGLLIVDGVLYSARPNPYLELEIRADDYVLDLRLTGPTDIRETFAGFLKGIDTVRVAPVTDEASLRDIVADLHPGRLFVRYLDLEVHDPDAFRFDERAEACARTVGQAIVDNQGIVHAMPYDTALEFLAIREGYTEWMASGDGDIVALLDRTYALFTTEYLYNQAYMGSFLANYATVQANLPDIEIRRVASAGPRP